MAFRDVFSSVKNWFSPNNTFFNGQGEPENDYGSYRQGAPAPAPRETEPAPKPAQQPAQPEAAWTPTYQTGNYDPRQNVTTPRPEGAKTFFEQGMQQPAPQPMPPVQEENGHIPNVCVFNTYNLQACRNAIETIRSGDIVVAVMDNLADPNELRRYVDMLNGAAYTLESSMTRLSGRSGVYIITPPGVHIYTDDATSRVNGQQPAAQSAYAAPQTGAFRASYPQPQYGSFYQQAAQAPFAAPQQPAAPQMTMQGPSRGYSPDHNGDYYHY